MSDAPVVTILVPVYNGALYVREALDSALAQDFDGVEVIVVDDGSTDDTAAIVEATPGVRLLRQENRGPAAARNAGLEVARGEFIAFLDADDRIPPTKLRSQVGYLQAHADVGCVLGRHEWIDGAPETLAADPLHGEEGGIQLVTAVIRKALLDEVGGFDESFRISEDRDLLIRLREHGATMVVLDDVVLAKRWHDASTTTTRDRPSDIARSLKAKLDRQRAQNAGGGS
jgi:glycosyltransferase involved in cell wall biosynthesis